MHNAGTQPLDRGSEAEGGQGSGPRAAPVGAVVHLARDGGVHGDRVIESRARVARQVLAVGVGAEELDALWEQLVRSVGTADDGVEDGSCGGYE